MEHSVNQKLTSFFSQYRLQYFKKGEILLRADDDPTGIYYLEEGLVKKYGISKKGDEIILNIYKSVSFFPMSWAFNGGLNRYYYEALSDSRVWHAPREKTLEFIKQNPDVLYDLIKRIYHGLDGMLLRMGYLMAGSAYSRLVNEIVIQSKRFGVKKTDATIVLKTTEKDLAMSAGLTRETVSREMNVLKKSGMIRLDKNMLTIFDVDQLEQALVTDL